MVARKEKLSENKYSKVAILFNVKYENIKAADDISFNKL